MVLKRSVQKGSAREGRVVNLYAHRDNRKISHYNVPPPELPGIVPDKVSVKQTFMNILVVTVMVSTTLFLGEEAGLFKHEQAPSIESSQNQEILEIKVNQPTAASIQSSLDELSSSLTRMEREMKRQTSYLQASAHLQSADINSLSEGERAHMRDILIRAGYKPGNDLTALKEEKSKKTVEDDVVFAKGIAKDVVKENIESFLYNMSLVTKVGEYVVGRVNETSSADD